MTSGTCFWNEIALDMCSWNELFREIFHSRYDWKDNTIRLTTPNYETKLLICLFNHMSHNMHIFHVILFERFEHTNNVRHFVKLVFKGRSLLFLFCFEKNRDLWVYSSCIDLKILRSQLSLCYENRKVSRKKDSTPSISILRDNYASFLDFLEKKFMLRRI